MNSLLLFFFSEKSTHFFKFKSFYIETGLGLVPEGVLAVLFYTFYRHQNISSKNILILEICNTILFYLFIGNTIF